MKREQTLSADDGLFLNSLGLSNIKFMGKCHVPTLVQYFGSEAQTIADLGEFLVNFVKTIRSVDPWL